MALQVQAKQPFDHCVSGCVLSSEGSRFEGHSPKLRQLDSMFVRQAPLLKERVVTLEFPARVSSGNVARLDFQHRQRPLVCDRRSPSVELAGWPRPERQRLHEQKSCQLNAYICFHNLYLFICFARLGCGLVSRGGGGWILDSRHGAVGTPECKVDTGN